MCSAHTRNTVVQNVTIANLFWYAGGLEKKKSFRYSKTLIIEVEISSQNLLYLSILDESIPEYKCTHNILMTLWNCSHTGLHIHWLLPPYEHQNWWIHIFYQWYTDAYHKYIYLYLYIPTQKTKQTL